MDTLILFGGALGLVALGALLGVLFASLGRAAGVGDREEELALLREDLAAAEGQLTGEVKARRHLEAQIAPLAAVLLGRFGGPDRSESACEMAARLLLEQRTKLEAAGERAGVARG